MNSQEMNQVMSKQVWSPIQIIVLLLTRAARHVPWHTHALAPLTCKFFKNIAARNMNDMENAYESV